MSDSLKFKINTFIQLSLVIGTFLTIYFSVQQFGEEVSNSILLTKKQMALEQTSALPKQVTEFSMAASDVAAGLWYLDTVENADATIKKELEDAREKQDMLLPIIKSDVLAYGSGAAVSLFIEFEERIASKDSTDIEAYYILPLLLSQIKMDVTGEVLDPMIFFKSLMPQFIEHNEKAKDFINKLITDFELNEELQAKQLVIIP